MKKLILLTPLLFNLNAKAQNLVQNNSLLNVSNISQVQSHQVFASNIMVNNSTNRPQVQRASNTVQRQVRRVVPQSNIADNPMVQQGNFSINEINDDIQVQSNIIEIENNAGNAFGNEMNPLEQIASFDIPAIQLGSGNLNLNLDITMPKINFRSVKLSGRGSSSSKGNHHQLQDLKKKWAKFSRKTSGKLSFKKKLKIKVDNCFKW